jgi:hypothetical protein
MARMISSGCFQRLTNIVQQYLETPTAERKYKACRVNMTVNSKGIIEYYETIGCGFMGMDNTGSLHKWGIN